MFIKQALIYGAGFSIHGNKECFVSHWFNMIFIMVSNIFCYLLHPFPVLEHISQIDSPLKDFIQFLDVADTLGFGEIQKFFVEDFFVYL